MDNPFIFDPAWTIDAIKEKLAEAQASGLVPVKWRVSPLFAEWFETQAAVIVRVVSDEPSSASSDLLRSTSQTMALIPMEMVVGHPGFELVTR